jgi:hypothetical protein
VAIADTQLLDKVRSRYLTLAGSSVLMGGWLLTWTLARKPVHPVLSAVRPWMVYGAALPLLVVLAGCAVYAAALARNAAGGDAHAARDGWRLGRVVYRLFAGTVGLLLVMSLFELVLSTRWRPGTLIGLLGAGIWGGWFLTVMRDQINLFGQAAEPSADRSGS